ncbi:S41 family peptidase [Ascidiimonas sp. W6]|uniref:S41 family peptidase n=1 Tax=Ascidiimonas meishanensis TaxID=3128903 RepID=UPI0030EC1C98
MKFVKKLPFLVFFIAVLVSAQEPLIYFPSLSPDGSKIAFNYQGDIWTAEVSGKNPRRITIHEGYDTKPIWSADGKELAFQSNRYGNDDVYVIPSEGGLPKRLTYHSGNDQVTDFTANGAIIFNSRRYFQQVEREPEILMVENTGGTPHRYINSLGFDAVLSPDGTKIAFTKGSCRIEREVYRGPANRDVWIYNIKNDQYFQITVDEGNDFYPQWAGNETLYFQSARSGKYNIYKVGISYEGTKNSDFSKITDFSDMGIFSYGVSDNATKLIATKGDHVLLLDLSSGSLQEVKLDLKADYRFDPVELKTFTSKVDAIKPSPNGNYGIIEIRGEIFVKENGKDKKRTVNLSKSAYRDRNASWLSDEKILFVSDRDGQNDLYLVVSDDSKEKDLFKTLKHKITRLTKTKAQENKPVIAPNGKSIAFIRGRGTLVVASIAEDGKLSNEKILLDGWDTPDGVAWSPDSQWISYSLSGLNFNEEVYIHKADNSKKPVNISMHPKYDINPIWSADGKKLVFSSNRNNSDFDVWFVWLQKEDWERTKEDWDELEAVENEGDKKKDKTTEEKSTVKVTIDFEGIFERQVQVTSYTGGEFARAISKDGHTIYYTTAFGGRGNATVDSDLYSIQWDGKETKALTTKNKRPSNVVTDAKGSYLYYTAFGGNPYRLKMRDGKPESQSFSAKMNIDYQKESNQIFEEAWKAINEGFYDPDFHGQDWEALRTQYKPLAMKASTRADFKTIFNWMLGQVNASHMGMYRGEDRAALQKQTTGLLGVSVKPEGKEGLKITEIVAAMPADRSSSKLLKGEIITGVNGHEIKANDNLYNLLTETANQKIYLTVKNSEGDSREVVIRPKSSARVENYNAWVNSRKKLTDTYSNGKLGYIHIQGMNWQSFERFERELTAAGLGKEGIVIDVRYNGGGWTTDYLMAVLTVRQHAYTVPRGAAKNLQKEHRNFKDNYPFSERLPLASWTKPSIALCNETSYSNAEIFSHAYKSLGIGTLVGMPTFGAVISTGSTRLIDGSIVRMPYRGWYVKSSEENMELGPAIPDIILDNAPDDKAKGKDVQLKRAVDELLKQIETK